MTELHHVWTMASMCALDHTFPSRAPEQHQSSTSSRAPPAAEHHQQHQSFPAGHQSSTAGLGGQPGSASIVIQDPKGAQPPQLVSANCAHLQRVLAHHQRGHDVGLEERRVAAQLRQLRKHQLLLLVEGLRRGCGGGEVGGAPRMSGIEGGVCDGVVNGTR